MEKTLVARLTKHGSPLSAEAADVLDRLQSENCRLQWRIEELQTASAIAVFREMEPKRLQSRIWSDMVRTVNLLSMTVERLERERADATALRAQYKPANGQDAATPTDPTPAAPKPASDDPAAITGAP